MDALESISGPKGGSSTPEAWARAREWYNKIIEDYDRRQVAMMHADLDHQLAENGYVSVEEMDRDIAASLGTKFTNHTYQLQALALEIAYQNARILVHRPLMTYKRIPQVGAAPSQNHSAVPFYQALDPCRDAALKISELSSSSIFSLAADIYASAFIGIHTFTAGVTLCILASIEPLTLEAHRSKMGLYQLLRMQRTLAPESQLASQSLAILERLTKLVMDKELEQMLAQNNGQGVSGSTSREGEGQSLTDGSVDFASFEFREDPTVSQALSDFDKAISGRISPETDAVTDDLERQLFPERCWDTANRFAQQQAWIWGGDCLARFPGSAEC
ncbi:unnamed protein product [Penicillium palitans]